MAKDPARRYQGAKAQAEGRLFEERLNRSFKYYAESGLAIIEKTPEPMRPIKSLGNGKFVAYYEGKAQPDYKGVLAGGRTILLEAKYTTTDRIQHSRVQRGQAEYLERHERLGAACYVVCGFSSGYAYRVPWLIWADMKRRFGRLYVTEADLAVCQIPISRSGILQLLDNI